MTELAESSKSEPGLSLEQQNAVSARAIANNFLSEISFTLSMDYVALNSDQDWLPAYVDASQAQSIINGLKDDPIKQQVLNQIAVEANDEDMQQHGISGSVQRDKSGNVVALEFHSPQVAAAFENKIESSEREGATPTQARASVARDYRNIQSFTGTVDFDAR